jgi:glycosyltransferase involved in cell wall biosynthesis
MPDVDAHFHDVHYYKASGRIETTRERWLPFVPAHYSGLSRAALEFYRGLREGPYDAVLTNASMTVLFPRHVRRTPMIMTIDSTRGQLDEMGGYGGYTRPALVEKYKRHIGCQMFDAMAMVVVTSRWAKAGVVAEYGIPEDKVTVVPFGADLSLWRPPADRPARTHACLRVLFVGGDFRRKGGEVLLDWFRRRQRHDVELHIVTRESVEPTPGVTVHRDIGPNSPRLLELYQQTDVFVLPSLAEAFGIATIEAMGCGLPVVVSDVGGTADIVDPGVNGFITKRGDGRDLASALETLLADADLRAAMGEQSRRIAEERFGLDKTARVMFDLLADLAARPSAVERPAG